jgi:hypothetical protein
MIEAQVHYVMGCLGLLREPGLRYLDVRPRVQRDLNDRLQASMARTVWQTGCRSWYLDDRGRNFTLWPGFSVEYWLRTRRVARGDFRAVGWESGA